MQLPPPHLLKAVELGLIDPEAVVPREWLYDFFVLCPATPQDCVAFFRLHGASNEVDDSTYLALLAGGFFRRTLDALTVGRFLQQRFGLNLLVDEGLRACIEELTNLRTDVNRAQDICVEVLSPYHDLADRLLADLPAPDQFSFWR